MTTFVLVPGAWHGGCLVNGAADAVPERVRALVYLDAFVPEDGDSCWSMANDEEREWYVSGAVRNGFLVDPLSFLDGRAGEGRPDVRRARVGHGHNVMRNGPDQVYDLIVEL